MPSPTQKLIAETRPKNRVGMHSSCCILKPGVCDCCARGTAVGGSARAYGSGNDWVGAEKSYEAGQSFTCVSASKEVRDCCVNLGVRASVLKILARPCLCLRYASAVCVCVCVCVCDDRNYAPARGCSACRLASSLPRRAKVQTPIAGASLMSPMSFLRSPRRAMGANLNAL